MADARMPIEHSKKTYLDAFTGLLLGLVFFINLPSFQQAVTQIVVFILLGASAGKMFSAPL